MAEETSFEKEKREAKEAAKEAAKKLGDRLKHPGAEIRYGAASSEIFSRMPATWAEGL